MMFHFFVRRLLGIGFLGLYFATGSLAHAHLMVEQHGTLKFGKGGYYFVLSLPVSAIVGIDDDGDGLLSKAEFRSHYNAVKAAVSQGYSLQSQTLGPTEIEGLLINISHIHSAANKPASHVVAMGRFNVAETVTDLVLKTTLFGKSDHEKQFHIAITRGQQKEKVVLSSAQASHQLFAKSK